MKNNTLKARIVERFGSQSDFAAFIQEREPLVSQVINGRRQVPKEKRSIWAEALKLNQDEIEQLL